MDRRSWPWKRKSHDKVAVIPVSTDTSPSRTSQKQDSTRCLKEHLQNSDVQKLEVQPCGECKDLSRKLSAALDDASAKDALIQQHKKLAEEAVLGWEEAQKEILSFRKQLEKSEAQKLDFLQRIEQLGGAMRGLQKELHEVREEQEKRIRSAIKENDNVWTAMKKEFETKFSRASHQLLKAETEKNALMQSLQEATKRSSELHHSNSVAEAEAKGHRAKAEALANENSALKHRIERMSKELDYCIEQRALERNETDVAKRRSLECLKRMEKLEAESQKLRIALRQKVTSSSLPMFWRLELESQKKNIAEGKKKHQRTESIEVSSPSSPMEHGDADLGATEKLSALEEEAKLLKEALTKRNNELQAARLMCARTAGKLSQVEEHLDVVQGLQTHDAKSTLSILSSPRHTSLPDRRSNEVYSAEAWAAALVTELAQFKKDRITTFNDNFSEISDLDLMDDFEEMEKIASRTAPAQSNEDKTSARNSKSFQGKKSATGEKTESKQEFMDLTRKLAAAEEKITAFKLKNISSEATVVHLQQKLDALQAKVKSEGINMETLRGNTTDSRGSQVVTVCNSPDTVFTIDSQEALNYHSDTSVNSSLTVKSRNSDQLKSTVLKILHSVELLIQLVARPVNSSSNYQNFITETSGIASSVKQTTHLNNYDLTVHSRRLVSITCAIVQQKTDISEFMTELAVVLEIVVAVASPNGVPSKRSNLSAVSFRAEEVEEETKDMLVPVVFPSNASVNESFHHCGDLGNGKSELKDAPLVDAKQLQIS